MKNISSTLTLICFLLLFCGSACKKHRHVKPIDQLPPATQEGKNTFGCYVNEKLFLPKGSVGSIPNLSATIDPYWHDGSFGIRAYHINLPDPTQITIEVGGDSIKSTGTYELGYGKRIIGSYSIVSSDTSYCAAVTKYEPQGYGYLKISRYDYENGVVSGEFEFTIIGSDCMDTIRITQGRFDYKFQ